MVFLGVFGQTRAHEEDAHGDDAAGDDGPAD